MFVAVGIVSGLAYGLYLADVKSTGQLVYVVGPSLSVVTDRPAYERGEEVRIRVVNSGTEQVTFADTGHGLRITGLSGILMYSQGGRLAETVLDPVGEAEFVWDQTRNDGTPVLEGVYKITSEGRDGRGLGVSGSATVTISR